MLKFTMAFRVGKYAWSEAHYWNGGSQPNSAQAIAAASALASARVPVLGASAQLFKVRISEYPANRLVWDLSPPFLPSFNPSFIGIGPISGQGGGNAEVAGLALFIDIIGIGATSTRMYLAGCPAAIFAEPGITGDGYDFSNAPAFQSALNAYLTYLTSQSAGLGWVTRVGVTFTPASQGLVTNAAYPGDVGIVVQSNALGSLAPGTKIVVNGWRRLSTRSPGLTGVYKTDGQTLVQTGPPQTWTYFLQNTNLVQPSNFFSKGGIALFVPSFSPYQGTTIGGATTRKRGASFGRPRGRSSIRL